MRVTGVSKPQGSLLLQLQRAIARRRRLRVWYDSGSRVIEPHCLGYDRAGDLLLRAYQTEGARAFHVLTEAYPALAK